MNKRIREQLDSWDLKSLFLTVLFFSIGLVLFFSFVGIRDRLRVQDEEQFEGQTAGTIIRIEKAERISQSKWYGTRIYVDSYKVTYQYNIEGQILENIDIIPVTTRNQKLLGELLKGSKVCLVRFDLEDPQESILISKKWHDQ